MGLWGGLLGQGRLQGGEQGGVVAGAAYGEAQAAGEHGVHAAGVAHEHAAGLDAFKHGLGAGAGGLGRAVGGGHAQQQHVAFAGVDDKARVAVGELLQPGVQGLALGAQLLRLGGEDGFVLQREEGAFDVEAAEVVGRAGLVDLADEALIAHEVADARAGQAEFAQGAHDEDVGVLGGALAGEFYKRHFHIFLIQK